MSRHTENNGKLLLVLSVVVSPCSCEHVTDGRTCRTFRVKTLTMNANRAMLASMRRWHEPKAGNRLDSSIAPPTTTECSKAVERFQGPQAPRPLLHHRMEPVGCWPDTVAGVLFSYCKAAATHLLRKRDRIAQSRPKHRLSVQSIVQVGCIMFARQAVVWDSSTQCGLGDATRARGNLASTWLCALARGGVVAVAERASHGLCHRDGACC